MTQLPSMISEVDFKLRCIAHFKKVFIKCSRDKDIQKMMKDQSVRFHADIREMIYAPEGLGLDRKLRRYANRMAGKLDIKTWLAFCLDMPEAKSPIPPEIDL